MWFNPTDILKMESYDLATFATPATWECENIKTAIQSRKVAGVAPSFDSETVITVTCRNCQHFTCFNRHGGGAGSCNVGQRSSALNQWADDRHHCESHQESQ